MILISERRSRAAWCHSPTLSQLARALILQVLVSKKWTLCLGDVKGAFLEAGPLDAKFKPLYARQPAGGIPGVDPTAVIEVLGNVYGANDAPWNWYHTFDQAVCEIGFERSQFDECRETTGVPGFHTGSGGSAVENFAVSTTLRILRAVKSAISSQSMPATLDQST